MQVINSSAFRERLAEAIAWLLPSHDAFGDLRRWAWTELAVGDGRYRLFRRSTVGRILANAKCFLDSDDFYAVVAALKPKEDVIVSFDHELCLELSETLADASKRRTHSILALSNLRMLPMPQGDYIWGWFRNTQERNRQLCTKVILRKDILNPVLAEIAKLGALCRAVVFRASDGIAFPIALAANGNEFNHARFSAWSKALAVALSCLTFSIAGIAGLAIHKQSEASAAVANLTETLTVEIKEFKQKLAVEQAKQQASTDLQSRKQNEVGKAEVLSELSARLPDGAFATSLLIDGQKISVDGVAMDPEGLVPLLESSPIFTNVTFAAPTIRNPGETMSHISLRMDIEMRAPKVEP